MNYKIETLATTATLILFTALSLGCSKTSGDGTYKRHVKLTNETDYTAYLDFKGEDNCRIKEPTIEILPGTSAEHSVETKCYWQGDYDGDKNSVDAYVSFKSNKEGSTLLLGDEIVCNEGGCNGKEVFFPYKKTASLLLSNQSERELFVVPDSKSDKNYPERFKCAYAYSFNSLMSPGSDSELSTEADCIRSSLATEDQVDGNIVWRISRYKDTLLDSNLKQFSNTFPLSLNQLTCSETACDDQPLINAQVEHEWHLAIHTSQYLRLKLIVENTQCVTSGLSYADENFAPGDHAVVIHLMCFGNTTEEIALPNASVKVGYMNEVQITSDTASLELTCKESLDDTPECEKI